MKKLIKKFLNKLFLRDQIRFILGETKKISKNLNIIERHQKDMSKSTLEEMRKFGIETKQINDQTLRIIERQQEDILNPMLEEMQKLGIETKQINDQTLRVIEHQQEELINQIIQKRNEKNIFIMAVHSCNNIGDLAISISEEAFLVRHFPNHNVFTISSLSLCYFWNIIIGIIKSSDIIVIHGGGNMGDLWSREEELRRNIINTFTSNVIISFPQSVYFQNKEELNKSIKTYESHKKLMLAARDDASADKMREYFPSVKVVRTEDIVFSYNFIFNFNNYGDTMEEQVLFILRNDKEKKAIVDVDKKIISLLPSNMPVSYTDTVENTFTYNAGGFWPIVYNKISQINRASLAVTDRLHGAIFAIHAGTPVIVFENSYGKISGALKNIKKRIPEDYILFVNDIEKDLSKERIQKMLALPKLNKKPSDIFADDYGLYVEQIKAFIDEHN